jgi:hypothetical protein
MIDQMLGQLRLVAPVMSIKKSKFEGVESTTLVFGLPAANDDFTKVTLKLDPAKAKTDKRHDPDQYAIGVEADLPVIVSVNFTTKLLTWRIDDSRAEAVREPRPMAKPSFSALKSESSGKTAA